jgi:hypothetical protein
MINTNYTSYFVSRYYQHPQNRNNTKSQRQHNLLHTTHTTQQHMLILLQIPTLCKICFWTGKYENSNTGWHSKFKNKTDKNVTRNLFMKSDAPPSIIWLTKSELQLDHGKHSDMRPQCVMKLEKNLCLIYLYRSISRNMSVCVRTFRKKKFKQTQSSFSK